MNSLGTASEHALHEKRQFGRNQPLFFLHSFFVAHKLHFFSLSTQPVNKNENKTSIIILNQPKKKDFFHSFFQFSFFQIF